MVFEALKRITTQGNSHMSKDELIVSIEILHAMKKISDEEYSELQRLLSPEPGTEL